MTSLLQRIVSFTLLGFVSGTGYRDLMEALQISQENVTLFVIISERHGLLIWFMDHNLDKISNNQIALIHLHTLFPFLINCI